jgi:dGTPase
MYLRVNTLNKLVLMRHSGLLKIFQIYQGDFNHALLEDDSSYSQLLGYIKMLQENMCLAIQRLSSLNYRATG